MSKELNNEKAYQTEMTTQFYEQSYSTDADLENNGQARTSGLDNILYNHQIFQDPKQLMLQDYLEQTSRDILDNDFLFLRRNPHIIQTIQFILKHWKMYKNKNQRQVEKIYSALVFRIEPIPEFQKIYPKYCKLKFSLEKKLFGNKTTVQEKNKLPTLNGNIPESDQLYGFFMKDLKNNQKNNIIEPHGRTISVQDYIKSAKCFLPEDQRIKWSTQFQLRQLGAQKRIKQSQAELQFNKQLKKEKFPSLDCLGCSKFFYKNMNIADATQNRTPYVIIPHAGKMKDQEGRIKESICAFLNSKGGVILFDCKESYFNVFPVGATLIQSEKNNFDQRIKSYLDCIWPKPITGKHIFINFVPIIENPFIQKPSNGPKQEVEDKNGFIIRNYIKGQFVMRIIVQPSDGEQFYRLKSTSWKTKIKEDEQSSQLIFFYTWSNRTVRQLKGEAIYEFIKNKYILNYIPSFESEDEKKLKLKYLHCFHRNKNCQIPDNGYKLYDSDDVYRLNQGEANRPIDVEKKFNYMTMLICKKSDIPTILDRLKKKGLDCHIEIKYAKYKFRAASNSAILYHNERFDKLLEKVAYQPEFKFGEKFILLILITKFIRLPERNQSNLFPEDQFESLQKWLQTQHPQEKLKLWRFQTENNKFEFYIQTQSKSSTLYIYFVLNHFNEKAIFKSPKDLDKIPEEEKKKRFILFYPKFPEIANLREPQNQSKAEELLVEQKLEQKLAIQSSKIKMVSQNENKIIDPLKSDYELELDELTEQSSEMKENSYYHYNIDEYYEGYRNASGFE